MTPSAQTCGAPKRISTHTLTWSVTTPFPTLLLRRNNFNSHAHVERDPSVSAEKLCSMYFNSHAHVERDTIIVHCTLPQRISTHTLTWSVTAAALMHDCGDIHFNSHAHVERDLSLAYDEVDPAISTHTLTWSVTRCQKCYKNEPKRFQLTRSRGA